MGKWFLPTETNFFDFFDQHSSLIVQAAKELLSLTQTGRDAPLKAEQIKQLEHEADVITHQCVESLRKTFITPFERDDIYRLMSLMDDIIDYIEETSARIALYKLSFMTPEIKELATILVHCTEQLVIAIKGIRKLKDVEGIKETFIKINELESHADIILRESIGRLFDEEQDVRTLIKWKEVYENLENAIDRCEDVSNIIEGVILEYG